MKSFKLLVFIFTCFFSSIVSYAQNDHSPFHIAPQLAFNTSWFNSRVGPFGTDDRYDEFVRISPLIGVKLRYQINEVISFEPEVNYSLRGGSYRMENSSVFYVGGNGDEKAYYFKNHRLNYLEIPLLLAVNFSKLFNRELDDYRLQVRLSAGLAPSINTESNIRYNGFEKGSGNGYIVDVEESYEVEQFDYAEQFVSNYVVNLAFDWNSMFVNLKYTQTTNNVYQPSFLSGDNMTTKMSTIAIGCGYLFNL